MRKIGFFAIVTLLTLFTLTYTTPALGGDAILSWDANTKSDLAGYKLYYETASGSYGTPIDVGNQTTYTITGLGSGTYYFAATDYDTSGSESGFSNEVSKTFAGASPGVLAVSPGTGLSASGDAGGPFSPSSKSYTLTNTGGTTISYTVTDAESQARANDLVVHWDFDEGSGTVATDSSGNGNNGTLVNGPTWTAEKVGGALSFDGVNDYVDVGDSDVLTFGSAVTFSVWAKIDTLNNNHRLFVGKRNGGTAEYQFGLNTANKLKLSLPTSGNACCTDITEDTTTLSTGVWYHFVVTFDDTANQAKWYINGILTETDTVTESLGPNTTIKVTIGSKADTGEHFDGIIDEVRIYDRALSATDIQDLYNISKGQSWVSLSKTSGSLEPGASTSITVSINSNAEGLGANTYSDTVSFTNTTNGDGNASRSVSLTVNASSAGNIPNSPTGLTLQLQ